MNDLENKLKEEVELYKKNAIEHINNESIIEASWDIGILRDLKAQLGLLNRIKEEN